jgi:hypothetical protein
MANKTCVDDFELVSIVACFAWTRRVGQWTSLDQGLENESRVYKWGHTKQRSNNKGHCSQLNPGKVRSSGLLSEVLIFARMVSTLVCLYG